MRRRSTAHPAQGGPVPLRGNSWRRAPRPAVAKRRGGSGVTARHRAAVTSQRGGCAFLAFFHTFFSPPFLVFVLLSFISAVDFSRDESFSNLFPSALPQGAGAETCISEAD